MPDKDIDRRKEILQELWPKLYVVGTGDIEPPVYAAMDEYFTERAYELLEYMAKRNIECRLNKYGEHVFWDGDAGLTKEQLFENFL